MTRITSLDIGYTTGDLSVYPEAIDSVEQLYEAQNNAETKLTNTLTYASRIIIVDDTTGFPDKGILRVGPPAGTPGSPELIYYGSKTSSTFLNLVRGYAGSQQNKWPAQSDVGNPVNAEHHNAAKDAILNIQANLGIEESVATLPTETGPLNGILKEVENKFLSPRALFRATYLVGEPPLTVTFQNISTGDIIRSLWNFGDGATSTDTNPTHTYTAVGSYTVTLEIITSTGGTGTSSKFNYITVDEEHGFSFFYITPSIGVSSETATATATSPTSFEFVDQTDGDVVARFWLFGDGESFDQDDPNEHTATHTYAIPGTYEPSVLVLFSDQSLQRIFLQETITVT